MNKQIYEKMMGILTKLLYKLLCFLGFHKIYHEWDTDGKGNFGGYCFCSRCNKHWSYEDDYFGW